uniref:NADH-ubiquinone oxidoreductase chain 6 n=1 Tax=Pselaphinae sp. 3 EF-2015 TaxID=1756857 RepID=A0A0S2M8H0_9COLE|nr:NADH deshydrogenase subunit 6 [Pselaphinae sp. 3 EF-2015]
MMLIMFNLMFSLMFIFLKHPLSMGVILLLQTLIISMITGLMNNNFWFSYILFLIFIGGMLILFMYMTSIASNEMFSISKLMILLMMTLLTPLLWIFLKNYYQINFLNMNFENLFFHNHINFNLIKFYWYPNNLIMLILIFYLLLTLIASVKIINIKYGPIRQKF